MSPINAPRPPAAPVTPAVRKPESSEKVKRGREVEDAVFGNKIEGKDLISRALFMLRKQDPETADRLGKSLGPVSSSMFMEGDLSFLQFFNGGAAHVVYQPPTRELSFGRDYDIRLKLSFNDKNEVQPPIEFRFSPEQFPVGLMTVANRLSRAITALKGAFSSPAEERVPQASEKDLWK